MSRKSSGGNKSHAELPWTASRCLRLLRPLTVHLKALVALDKAVEAPAERTSIQAANSKKRPRYGNEEDAQDLAWDTRRPPKKLKKTYGSRPNANETRHNDESQTRKGEATGLPLGTISMPTPFLNRNVTSSPMHHQDETPPRRSASRMGPPASLPVSASKKRTEAISQVVGDLNHILDQTVMSRHRDFYTKSGKQESATDAVHDFRTMSNAGAPPLFSMCIRAIPAYITNEEEWAKEEEEDGEDDADVTASTYSLLEDMGQSEERGWAPLGDVVQGHAVYAIRQVVESGHINHVDELRGILQALYRRSQGNQARDVMRSYILAQQNFASPTLARRLLSCGSEACFKPSGALCGYAISKSDPHAVWSCIDQIYQGEQERRQKLNEQINTTRDMLQSGKLLAEWLSCPHLVPQWTQVLRNLSTGRTSYDVAVSFVHHYLRSACQLEVSEASQRQTNVSTLYRSPTLQEAALRTLISLLSTLITFSTTEKKHANGLGTTRPLRLAVLDIHLSSTEELADLHEQAVIARMLVLVTDLLALQQSGTLNSTDTMEFHLISIMALHTELSSREGFETSSYKQLAELICAICSSWSRATQVSGVSLLRDVVGQLVTCAEITHNKGTKSILRRKTEFLRFFRRVGLEAAMLFATRHPSQEAASYLQTVETFTSQSTRNQASEPSSITASCPATVGRPGFRWEQGISEWVASTPASLLQVRTLAACPGAELTYEDAMETPAVVDSIKRWRTLPKEMFVGVVIPPCNIPATSPWNVRSVAHNSDVDNKLKMSSTTSPISFEVSGVFVASEDDKENHSAAVFRSKENLAAEQDYDDSTALIPPSFGLETKSLPARRQRSSRSNRQQRWAEVVARPKRMTRQSNVITAPVSPSPSSQSSEAGVDQSKHVSRLTVAPRRVQLQEDDSEDELSIHEIDCSVGAKELRTNGLNPLLGQVAATKSWTRRRSGR